MKIRLRGRKLAGGLGPLLALALLVSVAMPALAVPVTPADHQFYGGVTICETPVEPGTLVTATIAGVDGEWTSEVNNGGNYGLNESPDYPDNLLKVPADDPNTPGIKEGGVEGDTVEFRVLGRLAGEALFVPDGTTNLDLQVTEVDLTVNSTVGGTVTEPGEETFTYDCGQPVDLLADPDPGYEFVEWTGDVASVAAIDDSTAADTFITMNGFYAITANFVAVGEPHDLTVTSDDCCTITVDELGEVGAGATEVFSDIPYGTDVELTAVAPDCCSFSGWQVDGSPVSGNPITVTMNSDYTAVATCTAVGSLTLTVDVLGDGDVEVDEVIPGAYPEEYEFDCCTDVELQAIAAEDWFFTGWSGDLTGVTNPTTIHMNENKTVTANFEPVEAKVLTVDSTDGGSVTSPGEGVFSYPGGTVVPLVADPDPCANFIGWTGDDVSTIADINAATTTITMTDDYTITANFVPPEVLKVVTLNDGWNTFSTPLTLNQCTDTWSKLEEENNLTGLHMVYRFDVSTGYWALIRGGDPVEALEGYYVNMTTEDETVSIIPDREPPLIPPSVELSNGLNFIGTPSLEDLDVVTALLDIYEAAGGYSKVINPAENDAWPDGNTYLRDTPPVPTMVACKAYWVVMPNPGAVLVGVLPPPL